MLLRSTSAGSTVVKPHKTIVLYEVVEKGMGHKGRQNTYLVDAEVGF